MASSIVNADDYKTAFLQACLNANILTLGTFTLKSGRQSPYFFNCGLLHRADSLLATSTAFARAIASHSPSLDFDILFGPAYKGIPLACSTVDKLAQLDGKRYSGVSYSFNRKEAKDHGEGGTIVGAPLKGKRVLIIDDVVTAGTAMGEAVDIVQKQGAKLVGFVVALDRMERVEGSDGSALGVLSRKYGVPALSILTLDDLIARIGEVGGEGERQRLEDYREKYKAAY